MQNESGKKSTGSRSGLDSNPDYPKIAAYNLEAPELSARQLSPLRLLATIIGGIFLAEVIAMLVVYAIGPMPFFYITVIDAGIMTILIFPLLFFLSFRPLLRYINKNRQAEEKNHLLSSIVEQTADTVVVTDRDGVIEYVNPAFEQMTGYAKEEALGKTPRVLKSGVHDDQFYKELWNTILSGEVYQSEIANLKRNGELFYEGKTITPLRDALGAITHFVATGKDITERKRAEEQLRKAYDELELRVMVRTEELRVVNSELEDEITEHKQAKAALQEANEKLQVQAEELELQAEELQAQKKELVVANERLFESRLDLDRAQEVGQIGSWRLDVQRNVLAWSDENYRIFGVPSGTPLTYETFLEIVHSDDRPYVDTQWNAGLAGEPYDIEHRIVVGGQVKWVREKAYLEFDGSGTLLGGFGITQDISERVEADEAIKASEEKYRSLFNNMSEGFGLHEIILDADGEPCDYRFLELNAAFEKLTGLSRENILGRTVKEVLPDIEIHWIETYGRVTLTGEPIHFINHSVPLGKWYETYCYSPRQNQFAVVFFDVTERVRVEEALRESENRYRSLVEKAPVGIYEINLVDRKLTSVNDVLCNETGYSREELLSMDPVDLLESEHKATFLDRLQKLASGQRLPGNVEYQIRMKSGRTRWALLNVNFTHRDGIPVMARVTATDVTERKQAEAEIQRAAEEVHAVNEELKRFNNLMIGRELRMIELKKEVNELCASANQPWRYPLDFEKESISTGKGSNHAEA
jgi:PAS domain S-box-containing protein